MSLLTATNLAKSFGADDIFEGISIDIPHKVNGAAQYAIDARLPGMVYAAVKASPVPWGKLKSYNFDAIRQLPPPHPPHPPPPPPPPQPLLPQLLPPPHEEPLVLTGRGQT